MALHTEKPGLITTGVASGAITKRRFVNYSDAQCSAIGQLVKGVSREEDSADGETFAIVMDGTALVEAGEALDKGALIMTNALGKAIIASAGKYIAGVVMRAQAVLGEDVEVRLGGSMISTVPTTTSSTSSSSTTTSTAA